jgi:hypothetical protein
MKETITKNYQLEKITGSLSLIIDPPDAQISIDNEVVSVLNPIEIKEGIHVIEVEKDGYEPYSEVIRIERNKSISREIKLETTIGSLQLTVYPIDAEVRLYKGNRLINNLTRSNYLELPVGEYRIEVSAVRYKTLMKNIVIKKNEKHEEEIRLEIEEFVDIKIQDIIAEGDILKNVSMDKSTGYIIINYDVDLEDGEKYKISLYLYDELNKKEIPLKLLSGDIGEGKIVGVNKYKKKIIWNYADEFRGGINNNNLYIKIIGEEISGGIPWYIYTLIGGAAAVYFLQDKIGEIINTPKHLPAYPPDRPFNP